MSLSRTVYSTALLSSLLVGTACAGDTMWGVCETMGKAERISTGYNVFSAVSEPFEVDDDASKKSMARSFGRHVQRYLDNARDGWEVNGSFSYCTKWSTASRARDKFHELKGDARGSLLVYDDFSY